MYNKVKISNPEKLLWPELGIKKIDYINILVELAPYIIEHADNRLLTTINYPDGYDKKSYYQKNLPGHAPDWINTHTWHNTEYIILDSMETLAWLGNMAAMELHTSFNTIDKQMYPSCLVFDLDPSKDQTFDDVTHAALLIYETLQELELKSYIKTSGASGLQIYIPNGAKYDYNDARLINQFFGDYLCKKYPKIFTMERLVKNRQSKLYFDYLQMWTGKSIITPYSPRATKEATVATPITWDELKKGIKPTDFTLLNITKRLKEKGDIFKNIYTEYQNIFKILTQ